MKKLILTFFLLTYLLDCSLVYASDIDLCPVQDHVITAKKIWNNYKQDLIDVIDSELSKSTVTTSNLYNALYNTQINSQAILELAYNCNDLELIDDVSNVYIRLYPYLKPYSLGPVNTKMWLPTSTGTSYNKLQLGQADYAITYILDMIAKVPINKRTQIMKDFMNKYLPVMVGHTRLLIWYDQDWVTWTSDCISKDPTYPKTFQGLNEQTSWMMDKVDKMNSNNYYSYCYAINDNHMWWHSVAARLYLVFLHDSSIKLVDFGLTEDLETFLKKVADLYKSRFTETQLTDLEGKASIGLILDKGGWRHHPDFAYSGINNECFPVLPDDTSATIYNNIANTNCSIQILDKKVDPVVSWDVSHARRFIPLLASYLELHDNGLTEFPNSSDMSKFAQQLAYGVSNKNLKMPLFKTYFDGIAGWYRVNYSNRTGFGYPPYAGTYYTLDSGFAQWAVYNHDLYTMLNTMYSMITTNTFTTENYKKALGLKVVGDFKPIYDPLGINSELFMRFSATLPKEPTISSSSSSTYLSSSGNSSSQAKDCQDKNLGDINCDKVINNADYDIWKNEFVSGQNTTSDLDSSGSVDLLDYEIWREHTISALNCN